MLGERQAYSMFEMWNSQRECADRTAQNTWPSMLMMSGHGHTAIVRDFQLDADHQPQTSRCWL